MSAMPPHSAATILVVDDEPTSRYLASRLLSREGYRLLEAASAEEALDVLHLAGGQVDLAILDVLMPGCDGVTLAAQVLERWPDQRILYMSADPAEVLVQHGLTWLDVPFLTKPYTRPELIVKVRQILERDHRPHPEVPGS